MYTGYSVLFTYKFPVALEIGCVFPSPLEGYNVNGEDSVMLDDSNYDGLFKGTRQFQLIHYCFDPY